MGSRKGREKIPYAVGKATGQAAALAVNILPELEKQARERQLATLKQGQEKPVSPISDERAGKATQKAGQMFHVGHTYVEDAKKIKTEEPELFAAVKAGTLSLTEARRQLTHASQVVNAALPSDKYRVVLESLA